MNDKTKYFLLGNLCFLITLILLCLILKPWGATKYVSLTSGRYQVKHEFLGYSWLDKPIETELSKWMNSVLSKKPAQDIWVIVNNKISYQSLKSTTDIDYPQPLPDIIKNMDLNDKIKGKLLIEFQTELNQVIKDGSSIDELLYNWRKNLKDKVSLLENTQ